MIENFFRMIMKKERNNWKKVPYPISSLSIKLFGIPLRIILLIIIISLECIIISCISETILFRNTIGQILITIIFFFIIYQTIMYYKRFIRMKQEGKNKNIERNIQYVIETNKLYDEEIFETKEVDRNGKIKVKKEKRVVRSIRIFYKENENELIIRIAKDGDRFNEKSSQLGSKLESSLSYKLDSFSETINYSQYVFKKHEDTRIILSNSSDVKLKKEIDEIYLTEQMSFKLSKQPHILVAGVTGSGKTTLLNYFIIELLKMNSKLYIIDPKHSDLASLSQYLGGEQVVSSPNLIAKTTRLVFEEMEERFKTYKENPENFIYGGNFLSYKLNPIVLVFDELGAFRASCSDKKVFNEVMSNLTSIILKGREMGVFVILSTQQPNSSNIPTELRDNLNVRISLGNLSDESYRMVYGEVPDETVETIGEGYVFMDGKGLTKPKKIKFPFLDYEKFDFIKEIEKLIKMKEGK
ncbi:FtsK/SpoIIIE domain-containing protein [Clostridium perfringens]|uniref:FtsK/SpoIIIE domain-containing protein n=1 Tax=Clostridium perfringens TaxID=1502 RepID=UPI0011153E60|nr:FtsK/SpoIIIE domain-containing protein [Clostridium perfringens]